MGNFNLIPYNNRFLVEYRGSDFKDEEKLLNSKMDTTKQTQKLLQKKFDVALREFYYSWGVGSSYKHKARFWDKHAPNVNVYPFQKFSKDWVKAMETSWLSEEFSDDFPSC